MQVETIKVFKYRRDNREVYITINKHNLSHEFKPYQIMVDKDGKPDYRVKLVILSDSKTREFIGIPPEVVSEMQSFLES